MRCEKDLKGVKVDF